ncbi:MAG TPA: Cof-type HAD-IIB family hydrolase [Lachnospiraceae bacterium]|nr:Cof-type HAD-IIB family hydrolase [Lachnospiraceae bacterium]
MTADKKILFADLDGTLLNSEKNIAENDLRAIREMTANGHKFVIATGRPIQSAIHIAQKYDFITPGFYIASFNGGLIYDCYEKKTIRKYTVPFSSVSYLFREARKADLHCHTYSRTHVISEHDTDALRHYTAHIGMPPLVVDHILDALEEEPIKLIVISLDSRKKLDDFRKKHASWEKGKLSSTFSSDILLEYANPASTKGNAVLFLCDYLHIPIENSIAVGDEENDITMIDAAGLGVVMQNGTDRTKQHADYITEHDNNHNGIEEIIKKFMPN